MEFVTPKIPRLEEGKTKLSWGVGGRRSKGIFLSLSPLDKQGDRTDPSHPVHVDNCILNAEAMVCVKEPPAYTFRDYR